MILNVIKTRLTTPLIVCGAFLLLGCVNDDYDSNEIDMTMGFGSDGLTLPTSSSAEIPLADILDLEDDGSVRLDADSNYVFHQEGGNVETVHPQIARIIIDNSGSVSHEVVLKLAEGAKGHRGRRAGSAGEYSAKGTVQTLRYEGRKPEEVKELTSATVEANLHFVIDPTALKNVVREFDEIDIILPEFLQLSNVKFVSATGEMKGNVVTFKKVSTANEFGFDASVKEFDFTVPGVVVKDDRIVLDGDIAINATVKASSITSTNPEDLIGKPIRSTMDYGQFVVTGATGKFNPTINLADLGTVEVTGVPDFLTDGNVVVDLDNPQILMSLDNDMNLAATVNGTLTSYKDGRKLVTVNVDGLAINANGETRICICHTDKNVPEGYTAKVVSNLPDLIKTIPDEIRFSAEAKADASKECTFLLGHAYNVTPKYEVNAPIAFGPEAQIVYKDTIDGWNSDIKDMKLTDDNDLSVELTANVQNRTPAYLKVTATAIGVDGRPINDVVVDVDGDISASTDGTPVASPLKIVVKQNVKGGINKLEGLIFTATGSASLDGKEAVTGITLNAKKHNLKVDDLKVTIKGKFVADFN